MDRKIESHIDIDRVCKRDRGRERKRDAGR